MRGLGKVVIVAMGFGVAAWALALTPSWAWIVASGFQQPGTNWLPVIGALLVPTGLLIAFGWWLIAKRDWLSARLFDDTDTPIAVDGPDLLRVGIIILGLGLLIVSIPRLLGAIGTWGTYATQQPAADQMTVVEAPWPTLAATAAIGLVQLVAGVLFLRRSEPIAERLWIPRRPAGPAPTPREISTCPACGAAFDARDYDDAGSAICAACHSPLYPGSVRAQRSEDSRDV
jgi:hypothetical protein